MRVFSWLPNEQMFRWVVVKIPTRRNVCSEGSQQKIFYVVGIAAYMFAKSWQYGEIELGEELYWAGVPINGYICASERRTVRDFVPTPK